MAGTLFPIDRPRDTTSDGEKQLFEALRGQLPDGWVAWHSLRLVCNDTREGEGDFVIAIPRRGLLVLEVKSGKIELRGGHWLQNGRPLPKAPRDQARGFAGKLADEVERAIGAKVPFGIGCAFPDVAFSAGPGSGDLRGAVLGARDLRYLAPALNAMVDRVIPRRHVPDFETWRPVLHRLWGETWVPRVCLRDQVEDAAVRAVALDAEQLGVLDLAGENPRALVEGAAGTGKTVVARELCVRRAAQGRRALYLCFTDALAAVIDQQLRAEGLEPTRARAVAIRQYARERLVASGLEVDLSEPKAWDAVVRRALEHLPGPGERPDTVVVDEAQDLDAPDWALVQALAGDGGLWVFRDPRQAFWRDRPAPDWVGSLGPRLRLRRQQRCPAAIAWFAERYVAAEVGKRPAGEGCPVEVVVGEHPDLLARLGATLDRLGELGARPAEIAVITLGGHQRSALWQVERVGEHRLVRADSPEAGRAVVADTFLRFKGLERPFIVLTELGEGTGSAYETRMHIALTRATLGVRILCTREDLARDPRLAELVGQAR